MEALRLGFARQLRDAGGVQQGLAGPACLCQRGGAAHVVPIVHQRHGAACQAPHPVGARPDLRQRLHRHEAVMRRDEDDGDVVRRELLAAGPPGDGVHGVHLCHGAAVGVAGDDEAVGVEPRSAALPLEGCPNGQAHGLVCLHQAVGQLQQALVADEGELDLLRHEVDLPIARPVRGLPGDHADTLQRPSLGELLARRLEEGDIDRGLVGVEDRSPVPRAA
mmetsp:Transcript_101518/g.316557  ORF Transcript_101518/g.316557 Transcript_101518/m.316557 type:complete len:221 (-) Transcript_101518:681-1343(-)